MFLEIIIAAQILLFIVMASTQLSFKKDIERRAEIKRLNYMAECSSASSMEEGSEAFDIDLDRKQQTVWNRHVTKILG